MGAEQFYSLTEVQTMNAQRQTEYDTRAGELLAWEVETGRPLPATVAEILALEDAGHVVDLDSGRIILNGRWMHVSATVIGEALGVILTSETVTA